MRIKHVFFGLLLTGLLLLSGIASGEMYQQVTYAGKQYEYNNRIRTILFVGVDAAGDLETTNRYTLAPRADTIELVIMDGYQKKISILTISRDTMTEIRRYTMDGTDRGTYVSHLGYAYTFGDGGKVSCLNLVEAVSNLLGGIPIHEYVVVSEGGIVLGNQLVGGVQVEVPNDDLMEKYPEMVAGALVSLSDSNVCEFVRFRDTEKAFSNRSRMERAQSFSVAFISQLREKVIVSPSAMWSKIESFGNVMHTSITRNQYLKLADELAGYSISKEDCVALGGTDVSGQIHDEVWLDGDEVKQLCLHLFYYDQE